MRFTWPFEVKDKSEYRRTDQGWDLQTTVGAKVLAIADGRITYAHDPGSDGRHFGDPYPVLSLTEVVDGNPAVYYGHTRPTVPSGAVVKQGDQVAVTTSPGGGGAPEGWLEIGWWGANGPTGDGVSMQRHLYDVPVFSSIPPAPPNMPLPPNIHLEGDPDVADILNLIVSLGDTGDGYNDYDGLEGRPFAPFDKLIGIYTNASDPSTNHRYSPIPKVAPDDFAGHVRVVVEGGPPNGAVLVRISVGH